MVVSGESRSWEGIAGGGRMKDVSGETRRGFSWLPMSVEAIGVSGRLGRGMTLRLHVNSRLSKTSASRSQRLGRVHFRGGAREVEDGK
jgi:hypothetical protein